MKKGKQTFVFEKGVYLLSGAAIVGEKEGQGPLKNYFDVILQEDTWGEKSFEKAERKMFRQALETAKLNAERLYAQAKNLVEQEEKDKAQQPKS